MSATQPPIVCDLARLTAEQRDRLDELAATLFPAADAVRELPTGYALGYSDASAELLVGLAEFLALDRICCAFVRYALVSEPGPRTVWLEMTGGHGAKDAIAADVLCSVDLEAVSAE